MVRTRILDSIEKALHGIQQPKLSQLERQNQIISSNNNKNKTKVSSPPSAKMQTPLKIKLRCKSKQLANIIKRKRLDKIVKTLKSKHAEKDNSTVQVQDKKKQCPNVNGRQLRSMTSSQVPKETPIKPQKNFQAIANIQTILNSTSKTDVSSNIVEKHTWGGVILKNPTSEPIEKTEKPWSQASLDIEKSELKYGHLRSPGPGLQPIVIVEEQSRNFFTLPRKEIPSPSGSPVSKLVKKSKSDDSIQKENAVPALEEIELVEAHIIDESSLPQTPPATNNNVESAEAIKDAQENHAPTTNGIGSQDTLVPASTNVDPSQAQMIQTQPNSIPSPTFVAKIQPDTVTRGWQYQVSRLDSKRKRELFESYSETLLHIQKTTQLLQGCVKTPGVIEKQWKPLIQSIQNNVNEVLKPNYAEYRRRVTIPVITIEDD